MVPVQWTNRVHGGSDYRAYAGQLLGGVLRVGDAVTVQPGGLTSTVSSITVAGDYAEIAVPGDAIAVELADQIDVGRGDIIVAVGGAQPTVTTELVADVCWLGETDLRVGDRLVLRHLSREVNCAVTAIESKLDLETLHNSPADSLVLNDIATIRLSLTSPVVAHPYVSDRSAGSVVAVDPASNATVGALMIRGLQ